MWVKLSNNMVVKTRQFKKKKTILTNYQNTKCNAINYNVIFIGKILYKEVFILLLLCELVLLCCACSFQFKYLQAG